VCQRLRRIGVIHRLRVCRSDVFGFRLPGDDNDDYEYDNDHNDLDYECDDDDDNDASEGCIFLQLRGLVHRLCDAKRRSSSSFTDGRPLHADPQPQIFCNRRRRDRRRLTGMGRSGPSSRSYFLEIGQHYIGEQLGH